MFNPIRSLIEAPRRWRAADAEAREAVERLEAAVVKLECAAARVEAGLVLLALAELAADQAAAWAPCRVSVARDRAGVALGRLDSAASAARAELPGRAL